MGHPIVEVGRQGTLEVGEVFQGQVAEGAVHIVDGLDHGFPGAGGYDPVTGYGAQVGQRQLPQCPG